MAKIKFHKQKQQIIQTKRIKSITRFDEETKQLLLQQKSELMKQQGATLVDADEIVVKEQEKQSFGL